MGFALYCQAVIPGGENDQDVIATIEASKFESSKDEDEVMRAIEESRLVPSLDTVDKLMLGFYNESTGGVIPPGELT